MIAKGSPIPPQVQYIVDEPSSAVRISVHTYNQDGGSGSAGS